MARTLPPGEHVLGWSRAEEGKVLCLGGRQLPEVARENHAHAAERRVLRRVISKEKEKEKKKKAKGAEGEGGGGRQKDTAKKLYIQTPD